MGQAKRRGTFEQRQAAAIERRKLVQAMPVVQTPMRPVPVQERNTLARSRNAIMGAAVISLMFDHYGQRR